MDFYSLDLASITVIFVSLLVVCPFLIPLLKKMDVNFFPKDAIEFFTKSIARMKEDREKEAKGVSRTLPVMMPKNILYSISPREKHLLA